MLTNETLDLIRAIFENDMENAKKAILAGANVNHIFNLPEEEVALQEIGEEFSFDFDSGDSLLFMAAATANSDILDLLITSGANKDYRNPIGETVLTIAAGIGDEHAVQYLIKHDSVRKIINEVDIYNQNAFITAIIKNQPDTAKILMNEGANVGLKSLENRNAFTYKALIDNPELLSAVIQSDEEYYKNLVGSQAGKKILEEMSSNQQYSAMRIFSEYWIKEKGNKSFTNEVSDILKETFSTDPIKAIKMLQNITDILDEDSNKSILKFLKNNSIDLPSLTVHYGNLEIANLLLRSGEKFNGLYKNPKDGSQNNTLLHLATQNNNLPMIKFLIKSGLDINARNSILQTPLRVAVSNIFEEAALELLKASANPNIPDLSGDTSFQIAQSKGLESVMKAMRSIPNAANQNEFVQNTHYIHTVGHALGLRSTLEVMTDKPPLKANIKTEGNLPFLSCKQLFNFLSNYCNHPNVQGTVKEDFLKITEAFAATNKILQYDGSASMKDLEKRFKDQKIAICLSNWVGHTLCEVFYKNHHIDTNRGEGMHIAGSVLRTIPNPDKITADFLTSLNPGNRPKNMAEIRSNLKQAINLDTYELTFPIKLQNWGTCTFANPKSAIMGILYLLRLEKLTAELQASSSSLLPAMMLEKEKLMKKQAMEYAHTEYKKFTSFIRNTAIASLMFNYKDPKTTPERKSISFQLMCEYLIQHHGQNKGKHARVQKKYGEVKRMLKIFSELNDQDRKKMLVTLGKNNVMLFEEAKRSNDPTFTSILNDGWPIKLSDILSQQDDAGRTPIMRLIILYKDEKNITDILSGKNVEAWINMKDNMGNTALHHAILSGNENVIKMIANHPKTDLQALDASGNSAFALAAKMSNANIMKIISNAEEVRRDTYFSPRS